MSFNVENWSKLLLIHLRRTPIDATLSVVKIFESALSNLWTRIFRGHLLCGLNTASNDCTKSFNVSTVDRYS